MKSIRGVGVKQAMICGCDAWKKAKATEEVHKEQWKNQCWGITLRSIPRPAWLRERTKSKALQKKYRSKHGNGLKEQITDEAQDGLAVHQEPVGTVEENLAGGRDDTGKFTDRTRQQRSAVS